MDEDRERKTPKYKLDELRAKREAEADERAAERVAFIASDDGRRGDIQTVRGRLLCGLAGWNKRKSTKITLPTLNFTNES